MQKVHETVAEIVDEQRGLNRTLGNRYYNLLRARLDRQLTEEQLNRICFKVMEDQRKAAKLKKQPIPTANQTKYERQEQERVKAKNEATQDWLEDLRAFRSEAGLQMTEKELGWYRYIKTGETIGAVKSYLEDENA